ncbi:LysE family transporter [Mesorhizobium sp. WSM1293]|uniref:LysE family transporter n=1 Tax=Mesorhizobium sp. WSM1293 TaxID=1040984 RepID=UPI0004AD3662|nr:LysE family transporter [Mesorhizobium sp. WSM1293]
MTEPLLLQPDLWRQLCALVLASAVIMGSPGPATISVTAVGAAFGLRHSLGYAWGIILGTIAVLLVVATGVMAVLTSMPKLAPLLALASAAYILYLAFKIATAPPLAVLAPMIVAIHALWLVAGAGFARFLRRSAASRIINLIFAVTLVLTTALAVFG